MPQASTLTLTKFDAAADSLVLESVADTEGDQDPARLAGATMAIQARVRARARARDRARARARARDRDRARARARARARIRARTRARTRGTEGQVRVVARPDGAVGVQVPPA